MGRDEGCLFAHGGAWMSALASVFVTLLGIPFLR
jgi:hypothetical protein